MASRRTGSLPSFKHVRAKIDTGLRKPLQDLSNKTNSNYIVFDSCMKAAFINEDELRDLLNPTPLSKALFRPDLLTPSSV